MTSCPVSSCLCCYLANFVLCPSTESRLYNRTWPFLYLYSTFALSCSVGASEPKNMIYMSRLGIWGEGTPFRTFEDFLHAIEKRLVPLTDHCLKIKLPETCEAIY